MVGELQVMLQVCNPLCNTFIFDTLNILICCSGRDNKNCYTYSIPSSWFMFDLGSRSVQPNYYSIRHGYPDSYHSLRSWELQGSNDATNWDILREHKNDTTLNGGYAAGSWPLPNISKKYRYLRVISTGKDSSGYDNCMMCGFEVYGTLFV